MRLDPRTNPARLQMTFEPGPPGCDSDASRLGCQRIVFTVTQRKNELEIGPVEEAKKMKCYKRLIYIQFVQVSGLCGPQFLSYLPKGLYGYAIKRYTNMAAGSSLFL